MPDKLKAKYHESVTYTTDSEPRSTDTGTQDGKDAEEKEAKMYKNVWCYPQGASKADKSVPQRFQRIYKLSMKQHT